MLEKLDVPRRSGGYCFSIKLGPYRREDAALLLFPSCHSFLPCKFSFFIARSLSQYTLPERLWCADPLAGAGGGGAREAGGLCSCGDYRPGVRGGSGRMAEKGGVWREQGGDVVGCSAGEGSHLGGWSGKALWRRGRSSRDCMLRRSKS